MVNAHLLAEFPKHGTSVCHSTKVYHGLKGDFKGIIPTCCDCGFNPVKNFDQSVSTVILPSQKLCHFTLLVYKLLQSGYPKYFDSFLKPRHWVYNTRRSQADSVWLEVPHLASSVHKHTKHFGLSFADDVPVLWNDVPSVTSLCTHSERS